MMPGSGSTNTVVGGTPVVIFDNVALSSPFQAATPVVANGQMLVLTHLDSFFYGEGGGGIMRVERYPSGGTFWYTQPTGGNAEWAFWEGFQVFLPGMAIRLVGTAGNFDVQASGWLLPIMP